MAGEFNAAGYRTTQPDPFVMQAGGGRKRQQK